MKNKGFTLAEVLITLAVIGVVAAMTLPTLNNNIQLQQLGTRLAKTYSQLENGLSLYMAQNEIGQLNRNNFNTNVFTTRFLNIKLTCNDGSYENCFARAYDNVADTRQISSNDIIIDTLPAYVLKDGTAVQFNGTGVLIDVNGPQQPNVMGYDLHKVNINADGSLGPTREERLDPDRSGTIEDRLVRCTGDQADYSDCFEHLLRNNFRIDY